MKKDPSIDELKEYISNYLRILKEIEKTNLETSINIKRPGVSPVFSESLCRLKYKTLFTNATRVEKSKETHPDMYVYFGNEKKAVEIKCTMSDFQDIRQDVNCDYLVWIDVKKINEQKIKAYILDNSLSILEKIINEKKAKGSRSPTRIQLREFLRLNPNIVEFNI